MSENLHDIEDLFRNAIEQHEDLPGNNVWDSIDRQLDKKVIVQTKRKYAFLKRMSAALLLFFIATVLYELQSKRFGIGNINTEKTNINQNAANTKPLTKDAPSVEKSLVNNKSNASRIDENKSTGPMPADNSVLISSAEKKSVKEFDKKFPDSANIVKSNADFRQPKSAEKNNAVIVTTKNTQKAVSANRPELSVAYNVKSKHLTTNKITEPGINVKNSVVHAAGIRAIINNRILQSQNHVTRKETISQNTDAADSKNNNVTTEKQIQFAKIEKMTTNVFSPAFITADEIENSTGKLSEEKNTKIVLSHKAKHFHFAIIPFFSPQVNFYTIDDDANYNSATRGRYNGDDIKKDERDRLSYSLGVAMEIPIKRRWSLETGLTYINKTVDIQPKEIYAQVDNAGQVKYRFDCSCGFTYIAPKSGTTPSVGDSIVTTGASNNMQYLSVPISINYRLLKGKFNIIPSVGVSVNFLINQKIETSLSGTANSSQSTTDILGLRKVYFNAVGKIGLQYNAGKTISITLTPALGLALSSINHDAAVKSYPNFYGAAAAIKIQL